MFSFECISGQESVVALNKVKVKLNSVILHTVTFLHIPDISRVFLLRFLPILLIHNKTKNIVQPFKLMLDFLKSKQYE